MMRSKASVRKLQKLEEKEDCFAVNSGHGIENCTRERMTTLLLENQISHPRSLIWDTNDGVPEALIKPVFEPCWLKRADFHAIHREDVTLSLIHIFNVTPMVNTSGGNTVLPLSQD